MIVILTPHEIATCNRVGALRQSCRLARNAEKIGEILIGNREKNNAMGVMAEYALAKAYSEQYPDLLTDWLENRAFVPDGDHKNIVCDLGKNVQVRATDHQNGGLVLQTYDEERFTYVLGIVSYYPVPQVRFVGWDRGVNLKKPARLMSSWPKPAYLNPQTALLPVSLLPPEELV